MEKLKKWINKNKGFAIICALAFILFIIMVVIFVRLLVGGSSNKYGNRLDGIDKVKISNEVYESVKEEDQTLTLPEVFTSEPVIVEGVNDVSVRLQGKIVYTTIELSDSISADKAKEIAKNTLDNYTEDELKYYDFSFFLKWKGEESDKVITGNKHHNLEDITWIKS